VTQVTSRELEVDRATERPAAFGRKIAAYLEWYRSGSWREDVTVWPVVLVVTPTAVRATSLRRTTETVLARSGGAGTEFRFAALAQLQDLGPLTRGGTSSTRCATRRLRRSNGAS